MNRKCEHCGAAVYNRFYIAVIKDKKRVLCDPCYEQRIRHTTNPLSHRNATEPTAQRAATLRGRNKKKHLS